MMMAALCLPTTRMVPPTQPFCILRMASRRSNAKEANDLSLFVLSYLVYIVLFSDI
jgi:hypothetical protein